MVSLLSKEIMCPFCLVQIPSESSTCPSCSKEITSSYRLNYQNLVTLVISAVGFSGHGKTVYLASLLHTLEKFSRIWPGFYKQALNQESLRTVQENVHNLRLGNLPSRTNQSFPIPSILCLNHIPSFASKLMVMYDVAGENFEDEKAIANKASYLKNSKTVFFLISLDDLLKDEVDGKEPLTDGMRNLLNTYILGIERIGGITKLQHLIVVFTKGDVLQKQLQDFPSVWEYVNGSELEITNWDMNSYRNKMLEVSVALKDFTSNCLGAYEFFNMSNDKFASVEYCLISSLGNAPVESKLTNHISPRRVIDPLLWTLVKSATINK